MAQRLGLRLIDSTCPVVTKLQERIRKFYDEQYQIVIFGKKDHAEVIGLRGVCNDDCVVVKSLEEAQQLVDLDRKTVLFSQTTMDKPTFHDIRDYFTGRVRELVVDSMENLAIEFHAKDTICGQVSGREQKLREYAREHELMIFIAGRKSSNGLVLFHICRDANPNTRFIEDPSELDVRWFDGVETVGISGATSTPHWLMQQVKQEIERFGNATQTLELESSGHTPSHH